MTILTGSFSTGQNDNDGGTYAWANPSRLIVDDNSESISGAGQTWGTGTTKTSQLLTGNTVLSWAGGGTPDGTITSLTVRVAVRKTATLVTIEMNSVEFWSASSATWTQLIVTPYTLTTTESNRDFVVSGALYNLTDIQTGAIGVRIKVRSNSGGSSSSSSNEGPACDFMKIIVDASAFL